MLKRKRSNIDKEKEFEWKKKGNKINSLSLTDQSRKNSKKLHVQDPSRSKNLDENYY